MKANITRLIKRNEEIKGTENYYKIHMECEGKYNGVWKLLGNSVPYDNVEHKVKGTATSLYLYCEECGTPIRYKLRAEHMEYIDFIE